MKMLSNFVERTSSKIAGTIRNPGLIMKMPRELFILFILLGVVSLLPIFLHDNLVIMHVLIMCLIWGVVAAAWDLMMGFAGIFTFGQVAFFAIGAYTSGMLTTHLGISPWLGILAGGITVGLAGILIGLPCLRLKGTYIALVTFALHMILTPLFLSDVGRAIGTGGSLGLLYIPSLQLGGYTFTAFDKVPWFYVALAISFLSLFAIYKVIHSPSGLAFTALRDSEPLAKSAGIDDYRYKLMVFGISAFLTGIIGAFYVHYVGVASVKILGLDLFLLLMVMIIIGGMGRFPGAVIGSFIVTFLNYLLRPTDHIRFIIFGAVVVVLVVLIPGGLMGTLFPTTGVGPADRFGHFIRQTFTRQPDKKSIEK